MQRAMEVEEIAEAINLLEIFDASLPSTNRLNDFNLGVELLKEYLAENPETPHVAFIENKMIAHTRRLLQFLQSIDSSSFSKWLTVLFSLVGSKKEIEELSKQDQALKIEYEKFLSKWRNTPELKQLINSLEMINKK
jgi:hypothetical protein